MLTLYRRSAAIGFPTTSVDGPKLTLPGFGGVSASKGILLQNSH